jgi:hypothetical protein
VRSAVAAGEVWLVSAYRRIMEERGARPGCCGTAIGGEAHRLLPSSRRAQTPETLARVANPGIDGRCSGGFSTRYTANFGRSKCHLAPQQTLGTSSVRSLVGVSEATMATTGSEAQPDDSQAGRIGLQQGISICECGCETYIARLRNYLNQMMSLADNPPTGREGYHEPEESRATGAADHLGDSR